MGSITEEELIHMVRDFIESESASSFPVTSSSSLSYNHQPPSLTLQEILGMVTSAEDEVLQKILKYKRDTGISGETTSLKKWLVIRLNTEGYEASLCKTSWVSTFGPPTRITTFGCPKVFQFTGDYEYIDVMMKDGEKGKAARIRLIVDVDFRSQFEVVRPTETYKELTKTLPAVFVGTEEKLNKIISLLCSAAKQSLKDSGLHIPPWRKASYMQSKWLSKDCKKVSLSTNMDI